MSRRNPPRSSRSTKPISSVDDLVDEWYPNAKYPTCSIDGRVQLLNKEAYLADLFGRADDLVVYSSFANKGKKRRHHCVKPGWAQANKPNPLSGDDGITAANVCKPLFSNGEVTWEDVKKVVSKLQDNVALFRSDEGQWSSCLQQ